MWPKLSAILQRRRDPYSNEYDPEDEADAGVKMRLPMVWLALLLFPLLGTAQVLPSLVPESPTPLVERLLAIDPTGQPINAPATPVLPIWSGANGQLLAVVPLPQDWQVSPIDATPGYGGPSTWHLAGSRASGGGLSWLFGNTGLHLDATLGHYLASTPLDCAAGTCDTAGANDWTDGSLAGSLGLGWSSAAQGLDLSYGLSWLQREGGSGAFSGFGFGAAPLLTLPDQRMYSLDSEASMYARGRWQFGKQTALDVAAAFGRGRISELGAGLDPVGPGLDLEQLSLSLGLDAGSLRGAIIGHVLSSDDPLLAGKRWTTLDLGVSWRTPWSGEISVGAQNLWSTPLDSARDAESKARTPYIQYRQDL